MNDAAAPYSLPSTRAAAARRRRHAREALRQARLRTASQ